MHYEWDTVKNLKNIKKHTVSFEQAVSAIEDPHRLFLYDEAHSQHEDRYIVVGYAEGLVLFVNEVEIDEDRAFPKTRLVLGKALEKAA